MATQRETIPVGLRAGGRKLWRAITEEHELDEPQRVQLTEACRAKDRLDQLDGLLRGEIDVWVRLTHRVSTEDYVLRIDAALAASNNTANLMKQLLAAIRLPDEAGRKPQYRGPRGVQKPTIPAGGRVSSLAQARAVKDASA